jgi:quercetin dioxygenase-like cupin family protein
MTEQLVVGDTARVIRRGELPTVNILGVHCEWKVRAEDTGDSYAAIENLVPPGACVPLHSHASPETFQVLEGRVEFGRLVPEGPEWLPAVAGDYFHIPGGVMHGFRNTGTSVARTLVLFRADLAAFFEEAGIPVTPGVFQPPTQEEIAHGLAIMRKHGMRFAE